MLKRNFLLRKRWYKNKKRFSIDRIYNWQTNSWMDCFEYAKWLEDYC